MKAPATEQDLHTYLAQHGATLTLNPKNDTITVNTDLPPNLLEELRNLKRPILNSLNTRPDMPTRGPGACIPHGHGHPWEGTARLWTTYRFPMPDNRVALGHWTGSEWRWTIWPNGPRTIMSPAGFEQLLEGWGHPPPTYVGEK